MERFISSDIARTSARTEAGCLPRLKGDLTPAQRDGKELACPGGGAIHQEAEPRELAS